MSSKKFTDADKLEIADLYRQSGETTSSLASRYGVSNSTIARILKNTIPEAEYEILARGKRGSRTGSDDDSDAAPPTNLVAVSMENREEIDASNSEPLATAPDSSIREESEDNEEMGNGNRRRVRRRISTPVESEGNAPSTPVTSPIASDATPPKIEPSPTRSDTVREIISDSHERYFAPPETDEGDDDAEEDVNVLAAMFGEEIADGEDDEDFAEEDWEDDATASSYNPLDRDSAGRTLRERILTTDRLHVRVVPLSQATLPRTCYIVVDKFAELIVRPLKDFADLGQIPSDEILQRTLPVFDNHRVAKRFSNQRTQRVIKVPDSRVFYKTTSHLRSKGIACLLVDGNIYSLN